MTPDDHEVRYRAMMEAAFEGLAVHDGGRIVDANPAFAAIFGYEPREVVGLPLLSFVAEQDHATITEHMESGSGERYEATGVRRDGSRILGEVRGRDIELGGELLRIVAVRDITLEKRMQQELESRVAERTKDLRRKQDELDAINTRLLSELALARQVQRSMLPDDVIECGAVHIAARYVPSRAVGGDVYQVCSLADGRRAVLVADVTGHGVAASLSTVLVGAVFKGRAALCTTPAGILAEMNAILIDRLPRGMFVAATVVVFDPETGRAEVANAGLFPPAVVHRRERAIERLDCNNALLGVVEPGDYDPGASAEVDLAPGNLLTVFTDGLPEVRDSDGAMFGITELPDLLVAGCGSSATAMLDCLLDAARAFARPGFEWDDCTMVVLERIRETALSQKKNVASPAT